MKAARVSTKASIGVSLFIGFLLLCMFYPTIERYEAEGVVHQGVHWEGMRPAGEITAGFHLRQSIRAEFTNLDTYEYDNTLCLDILFATFGRRRNEGHIRVKVTAGQQTGEQILEVDELIDNTLRLVCFPSITFRQVYQQEAWVDIEGIDGKPGKSVTAVVSSTPGMPRVTINGQDTVETLVYYPLIRKDPRLYQLGSFVLIGFATVIGTLLLMGGGPRQSRQPPAAR